MGNDITREDIVKRFEERHGLNRYQMVAKLRLLEAFRKRYGDEAFKVVEETIGESTKNGYASLAARRDSNSIEDLLSVLWEPAKSMGMEYTSENTSEGVQMNCTKCPWYEYMKELDRLAPNLNALKWGYYLYCISDPYICEGFNSNMGFRRSRTLMEGHDCCDHFYCYKDK